MQRPLAIRPGRSTAVSTCAVSHYMDTRISGGRNDVALPALAHKGPAPTCYERPQLEGRQHLGKARTY
ncbi:unnamed protein product, partial [Iphiclides podalirius]